MISSSPFLEMARPIAVRASTAASPRTINFFRSGWIREGGICITLAMD
jgi:hypothetical protein